MGGTPITTWVVLFGTDRWFSYRVAGVKGRRLTMNITNAGQVCLLSIYLETYARTMGCCSAGPCRCINLSCKQAPAATTAGVPCTSITAHAKHFVCEPYPTGVTRPECASFAGVLCAWVAWV